MTRTSGAERRLITLGALVLGVYNLVLSMFPAPFAGFGEVDVVPKLALEGSRFILVLIGIVLIVSTSGLWHGKRSAWAIAVLCALVSTLAHPVKDVDVWGTVGSLVLLGTLIGARPQFPARNDPPTAWRGLLLTALGLACVFAYSTIGLYFLDAEFRQPLDLLDAIGDGFRLLFLLPATGAQPVTSHGYWFLDSVRLAFLFVIVLGIFSVLKPVVHRARASRLERRRVMDLLAQYGDSTLAYFSLQPDKSYFFSDTGRAVLAYKVKGNTAVVMGEPIGDPTQFDTLLDAFQQHCELDAWAYAFHQVRPAFVPLFEARGMRSLKIGEEGYVDVQAFSLTGSARKHLRATMNRFEREGYRAEVLSPPHPAAVMERLAALSDAWLAQRRRRERAFVVGYFDRAMLQENDVLVARNTAGEIVAFANVIPSYNSDDGNFDMLRHDREPKDVADYLYVSLIAHFRERGFRRMTIGLAPLAGLDEPSLSPADAAMRLAYRYGSFMFRFKGLREFKEKYATEWEPRYLIYGKQSQLTGVAVAVGRAGELESRRPVQEWALD